MSSEREIITLQLGHYSNHIGTHLWNIQESLFNYDNTSQSELNHNVFYREGLTLQGEVTYTPRLLLFDLKGSLGTLNEQGFLYEKATAPKESHAQWDETVQLCRSESEVKNKFLRDLDVEGACSLQDEDKDTCLDSPSVRSPGPSGAKVYHLDESVKVWSDFLHPHLHPRSVLTVKDFCHGAEDQPFNIFGLGLNLWNESSFRDEVENRLRLYTEECDYLQGFNILVDSYDGFSGLSSGLLTHLEDDYSAQKTFVLPSTYYRDCSPIENCIRQINMMLCYDSLQRKCNLFAPIGVSGEASSQYFPHLNLQICLPYHSSAVLACALDTLTLPFRLHRSEHCSDWSSISDFTSVLSQGGRKAAAMSLSMPLGIKEEQGLQEFLEDEGIKDYSLMPKDTHSDPGAREATWVQLASIRGVPRLYSNESKCHPRARCNNAREMLRMHVAPPTAFWASEAKTPCKVTPPFPDIFQEYVSPNGLLSRVRRPSYAGVTSVPAMATISSSSSVRAMLTSLSSYASKVNVKKIQGFLDAGLEIDDYKESLDNLKSLSECYQENMET